LYLAQLLHFIRQTSFAMMHIATLYELEDLLRIVRSSQEEVHFKQILNTLNDEIDLLVQHGATLENRTFLYDLVYITTLCHTYTKSNRTVLYEKIIFDLELAITKEQVRIHKLLGSKTN
jgi:hypothetical protein